MTPHRGRREQAEAGIGSCSLHAGIEAVARCASCGRATCIECAVPVRGSVLCRECAAREVVGVVTPAEPVRTHAHPGAHAWAAVMLASGLLVSSAPWDRFGILTSFLSAWRPGGGVWPPLAAACLAVGALLAAVRWRRPAVGGRRLTWAYVVLALVAAAVIAWRLVTAPAYVSPSPIPFVVVSAAIAGAMLGALGLRRRPR